MSLSLRLSLFAVLLAATAAPSLAQDDGLDAPRADTVAKPARTFSPSAISDLLKHDAPAAVPAKPARTTSAVPRALDVPVDAGRAAPEKALASARAPLSPDVINAARFARVSEIAKAGADGITVHVEATAHLHYTLQMIREAG